MTIEQVYHELSDGLSRLYERREAENIADWVFENVTGLNRLQRRADRTTVLSQEDHSKVKNYLLQLLQHKPVQYVLNEAWFYKMKFYVNEDVLIPRPETEELVSWIIEDVKRSDITDAPKILDVGTGSGCISVALKKSLPFADVAAIDISELALIVAGKNARQLDASIDFMQLDFLDKKSSNILPRYDIIVSNPPYIPLNEKEKLSKNVAAFEPAAALFVDDKEPFIFYKTIAGFGSTHLEKNGKIYVEIHEAYAREVAEIFAEQNYLIEIRKDVYGRNRMIKAGPKPDS
ncbi:MAG TPA: peptide chain release factor N(5)-glutamine methyltransferase [Chitinophagaceae bacterium]|nr:peptide chain release factor N(5)-glutamine methyltransferase [Chitinophagaceae bacterium]